MASWTKVRKQVFERDNHTCKECGETEGELHAHHKIPRYDGGTDDPENLTTLCRSCHIVFHTEELHKIQDESRRLTGQA